MLRVEVNARALRASQHVKCAKVGAAKLRDGGRGGGAGIGGRRFGRGLWPSLAWEQGNACSARMFPERES